MYISMILTTSSSLDVSLTDTANMGRWIQDYIAEQIVCVPGGYCNFLCLKIQRIGSTHFLGLGRRMRQVSSGETILVIFCPENKHFRWLYQC